MFEDIRDKMRERVRHLEYVVTIHAEEEMETTGFPFLMLKMEYLPAKSLSVKKIMKQTSGNILLQGKPLTRMILLS